MEYSDGSKPPPRAPGYAEFRSLPDGTMRDGKLALNKYSAVLTNDHDFPGAQVRPNYRASSHRSN
jgi:dihydroxy-acid dehydratase